MLKSRFPNQKFNFNDFKAYLFPSQRELNINNKGSYLVITYRGMQKNKLK